MEMMMLAVDYAGEFADMDGFDGDDGFDDDDIEPAAKRSKPQK